MRCIRKFNDASLGKLGAGLLREVHDFRKGQETNDDLTLMIVEIE
jgi:hypothetical protein